MTNGWCYLFVLFGTWFRISWMLAVGSAWAALLWLPFTPEKLLTLAIAVFLLRLLFPKDQKTLRVLRKEEDALRRKLHGWLARRRRKKQVKRLRKALSLRREAGKPLSPPREGKKTEKSLSKGA